MVIQVYQTFKPKEKGHCDGTPQKIPHTQE